MFRQVSCGAVVTMLLVAVAGCSSGDPEPTQSSADRSVPMYVDQVDPDERPIAEFTADAIGEKGQVTVQVLSLEVTGDVMLLRVALTPLPLDDGSSPTRISLFETARPSPVLYDVEHMVLYRPLGYSSVNQWRADGVGTYAPRVSRGEPFLYWTYFDAPDDQVDQLDLTFNDQWPVVEDVPVVWS